MSSQRSLIGSAIVPLRLVFLMWLTFSLEIFLQIDLGYLGIKPRSLDGLLGILMAPMIHGSLSHLISNTYPVLFLGTLLFYVYPRIAGTVFLRSYLITNILVWILSPRPSFHIGASGLVYGLSAFLMFFGFLRQDFLSLVISIIIVVSYGGIFYGVLPVDDRISWESHLAGAIVGTITAFDLSNRNRV